MSLRAAEAREPCLFTVKDMVAGAEVSPRVVIVDAIEVGREEVGETLFALDSRLCRERMGDGRSGYALGSWREIFEAEKYIENALLATEFRPLRIEVPAFAFIFLSLSLSLLHTAKKSRMMRSSLSSFTSVGTSSSKRPSIMALNSFVRWSIRA